MSFSKKNNGKANAKYFESPEVLKQLEEVKDWLLKSPSLRDKKVSFTCQLVHFLCFHCIPFILIHTIFHSIPIVVRK